MLNITWASITPVEIAALAICPKVSGALSAIADIVVLYRVLSIPASKRHVYDRIILGMAAMNFVASLFFFMSSWGFFNESLCTAQGFILQLNSAVFWYNGVLATHFFFRIARDWSERQVQAVEVYMHLTAWLLPVVSSFLALGLGLYGPVCPWCWIVPTYAWYRFAFFHGWLWACMIYCAAIMVTIVRRVHKSDLKTRQRRGDKRHSIATERRMSPRTREVAQLCVSFVLCFWLTWIFGLVNVIYESGATQCNIFALALLQSIFEPLQGVLNFLVYLYPRYRAFCRFRAQQRKNEIVSLLQLTLDWCEDIGRTLLGKMESPVLRRKTAVQSVLAGNWPTGVLFFKSPSAAPGS